MAATTELIWKSDELVERCANANSLKDKVDLTAEIFDTFAQIAESRGDDFERETWESASDMLKELTE